MSNLCSMHLMKPDQQLDNFDAEEIDSMLRADRIEHDTTERASLLFLARNKPFPQILCQISRTESSNRQRILPASRINKRNDSL